MISNCEKGIKVKIIYLLSISHPRKAGDVQQRNKELVMIQLVGLHFEKKEIVS